MCGIVGYVGNKIASNFVLKSLKFLDYRGYDSAGVGFLNNGQIEVRRVVGSVENLQKTLKKEVIDSGIMIGHTRWATHGGVSIKNAHPQIDNTGEIAVVHNGIIENYEILKSGLQKKGIVFHSQTDTEVIPNMLHIYLRGIERSASNILLALSSITKHFVGTFALCVIVKGINKIFVCSRFSPLTVCKFKGGVMVASDVNCLPQGQCFKLPDNSFAVLEIGQVKLFDENLNEIVPNFIQRKQNELYVGLNNFSSFMEKEIFEGGEAITQTLNFLEKTRVLDDLTITSENKVVITACGTALHAGRIFAHILKKVCNIECCINFASEFRYFPPKLRKEDVCFFISQSGETADTLSCLHFAKSLGVKTVVITNVVSSTMADVADKLIPTKAGVERAVASTKAFMAQLAACYAITFNTAQKLSIKCPYSVNDVKAISKCLNTLEIHNLEAMINQLEALESIYVLGRGIDFVSAMEGALKIKEVSYIHCEAIPLGELKHGSIALFNKSTYCFVVMTDRTLYSKVKNNINEIKSRGAKIILITNCEEEVDVDYVIKLDVSDILSPFLVAKVFQTFALKLSLKRRINVDKPRNLAKSVTVE